MPNGTPRLSIGGQSILRYIGASTFASHIVPPGIALAKVRRTRRLTRSAVSAAVSPPACSAFSVNASAQIASGIFGHSMGGNGALTLALRHPGVFKRLQALAPICAPTRSGRGRKPLGGDLGADETAWAAHDASALMQAQTAVPYPQGIRIDQDAADKFLAEQLHPKAFEWACAAVGQPLALRRHAGYDHGYRFAASRGEAHLHHHAGQLTG